MFLAKRLRWVAPAVSSGTATLVAGVGGGATHTGYSFGAGTGVGNSTAFGSLSDTTAPGGRQVAALYWDSVDAVTYLVLFGNTHAAFLTGLQIWIGGVGYTCGTGAVTGSVSYAQVAPSNIFVSGNSYSVSFTAPGASINATASATISLGGSAVAVAAARAAAAGTVALGGAAVAAAPAAAVASGAIALGGGGAAAVPVAAAASGVISLGGSAVASGGTAPITANAAALIPLGGAAAAAVVAKADGAAAISLGGSATAAAAVQGQAAGSIALGGSAAAVAPATAQASASIGLSGSGAASGGVPAITPPAGVFPDTQAALDIVTHFDAASSTGTYVRTASGYSVTGAASLVFTLPAALTGNYWVSYHVAEEQPGSHRPGYLTPTYTPNALRSRGRNQVYSTPAVAGSTKIRIITSSGFAGEIEDLQLIDMATYLSWPADVWVAWWQSNMAATTQSLGYDKTQDAWADPRLQCFPGAANTQHGTTLGEITALRAPLQMQSNVAEALSPGMISAGVSPAVNFVRGILPKLAAGRRLVLINAAVSGTGIEGATAPWNPASSNPFAYNHMMSLTAQAMAALPAGSIIRGMIGAGGESDTSADMSTHSAALNAVLVASGNTWVAAGYCAARPPCVLVGPPPDATRANQAVLVACHANLDRDSGHPTSISNVHVAPTGNWGCEDSTHRTAPASRLAGTVAANLAIARGLAEPAAVGVVATASASISLGGSAVATAAVQGQAQGVISLGGSAAAGVNAAAQAAAVIALGGAAVASVQAKAQASGTISLIGSAVASGGFAPITAQGTATISLTGAGVAVAALQAQAQGAIALGGSANVVAMLQAQAAAAIALSGSSAATVRASATAAGFVPLAGSGAAFALLKAIAAGSISLSASAVAAGTEPPITSGTGSLYASRPRLGRVLNSARDGEVLNLTRSGKVMAGHP